MPQLESSTFLTQIFWLITTFVTFWFIMAKLVIPKISEMIEARKRKYSDFILKAEEVNKKALETLNLYEETLSAAKANANEQIAKNEQELKNFITAKENEISEHLKQKIEENNLQLEQERIETLKKIDEISQNAVYAILQQLDVTSIKQADVTEVFKGIQQ